MTLSDASRSPKPPLPQVAEVIALACVSTAMYRLQHVDDPLMIVWAACAIIIFTGAVTIARAVERSLSRILGMTSSDTDEE